MHEFWIVSSANMTYTTSKNYTNMMVDKHGIQTFKIVVVVLLRLLVLFDVFCSQKCTSLIIFRQVVC